MSSKLDTREYGLISGGQEGLGPAGGGPDNSGPKGPGPFHIPINTAKKQALITEL